MGKTTGVRMSVRENGEDILVYHYASIREAVEIQEFIREYFPRADFVFEPLRH